MARLAFIGLIVLLLAGGYLLLSGGISPSQLAIPNLSFPTASPQQPSSGTAQSDTIAPYSDPEMHFSLTYPKGLDVHVYDEGDGSRTTTFEGPSPGEGFQVFVQPYGKDTVTEEQFKKDEPSGVRKDAQNVSVQGAPATIFTGHNDMMGDTREAWMIRGGYLYEIVTYKALDSWLQEVLASWRFI